MLVCFWSPKGGSGTSVVDGGAPVCCSPARRRRASPTSPATSPPCSVSPTNRRPACATGCGPARKRPPTRSIASSSTSVATLSLLRVGRARASTTCCPKPAPRSASRSTTMPGRRCAMPGGSIIRRSSRSPRLPTSISSSCAAATSRCGGPSHHGALELASGAVLIDEHGRSLGHATSRTCSVCRCSRRIEARTSIAGAVDAGVLRHACPRASPGPLRHALVRIGCIDGERRGMTQPGRSRCDVAPPVARGAVRSVVRWVATSCATASPDCCATRRRCSRRRRPTVVLDELVDDVGGLGPLEPLLADPTVTEIMVNGPGRVYVERDGRDRARVRLRPRRADDRAARRADPRAARSAPRPRRRRWSTRGCPTARACTRCSRRSRPTDRASRSADSAPRAVRARRVRRRAGARRVPRGAGARRAGTSSSRARPASGKTTLLQRARAVRSTRPNGSSRSRRPPSCGSTQPHVVRLEARPANAEGAGAVGVRDLVRAALRMRPDRLVVGEVRGGEALDMLQACNTGHDGSLSTVHAERPADALARLETLALVLPVSRCRSPRSAPRSRPRSTRSCKSHGGSDGRREIVTVAEVQPGRVPQACALLTRVGSAVEKLNAPTRPSRRRGVDLEEVWHACALSSSR